MLYGAAAEYTAAREAKFFVPAKPRDVYEAMAVELLKGDPRVAHAPEFPEFREPDHPRPEANAFYRDSRFHRRAIAEPATPMCSCKQDCAGAVASYKCFSCAKVGGSSSARPRAVAG
jgi:hypothetical protein